MPQCIPGLSSCKVPKLQGQDSSGDNYNHDKSSTSATSEENLVTKRVDTISYSTDAYDASESSKCDSLSCEMNVCNPMDSPEVETRISSLHPPQELKEDAVKPRLLLEVKPETCPEKGVTALNNHETSQQNGTEQSGEDTKAAMPVEEHTREAAAGENAKDEEEQESTEQSCSFETNLSAVVMSESGAEEANHNGCCLDPRNGDDEEREMALLKTISDALGAPAVADDESKVGRGGHQRADALESLLELCARLLKEDKFGDLSGVLRPFGQESVSSWETAIWLTKSLMAAQKSKGCSESGHGRVLT